MNPEVASLTMEQQAVLQAVYDYFHEHAAWPTFITIDRPIRRDHGWDTAATILSLPESLMVPPRPGRLKPIPSDELRLRLPGIHACRGGSEDTERFLRLLRWLAEREMAYEPPPGTSGEEMPRVASADVSQFLGLGGAEQIALQRLYVMLQLDNWGLSGASGTGPDGWYVTLGQDVWRFRNVQTVEDYINARESWVSETPFGRLIETMDRINSRAPVLFGTGATNGHTIDPPGRTVAPPVQATAQPSAPSGPPSYVGKQIVQAIRAKDGQSTFNVTKLLGLIAELNQNYARRNTYASHALLRAILDHVPPILGCVDFKAVANNYSWGRTDKNYMKRLLAFRDQADDALHRQISAKADVLDFDDMPASVCVDRLLQECAGRL